MKLDESENRFYFSHSYYVQSSDQELRTMETEYKTNFIAGYQKGNIFGVQFHPEKSHRFGMEIFRNFANL
jgi:glutamine amidotransferase